MCSIVVVSPLVSVMRDQVDSAKNTGKTRKRREKVSVNLFSEIKNYVTGL